MQPVRSLDTRERRFLAAILVVAAALRLLFLARFPEVTADEGLWTNSTKNFLLFGDWFMDGRNHVVLSPLFHGASLVSFALLGPGIASARVVSALAGLASVWLLFDLVRRTTGRNEVGLVAAALLAVNETAVMLSRTAFIESLELCMLLLAALCLVRGGRWTAGAVLAGGLAFLAKLNAAPVIASLGLWCAWRAWQERRPGPLVEGVIAVGGAMVLAAAVYGAIYLAEPVRFVQAYRFELDGRHFEFLAQPIVRVGRFGLDPEQAGRTIIRLFREAPFLWVTATLGIACWTQLRTPRSSLFAIWFGFTSAFFLSQMFQPARYFFLVAPAALFFCAIFVTAVADLATNLQPRPELRRIATAMLAAMLLFDLAFTAVNGLAHPGGMVHTVRNWVVANVDPGDRVMSAGYLATDLPHRTYAHYHIATDSAHLADSLRAYDVRWVVYDSREWPRELHAALEARYARVAEFPFGAVYRIDEAPSATGVEPPPAPRPSAVVAPLGRTQKPANAPSATPAAPASQSGSGVGAAPSARGTSARALPIDSSGTASAAERLLVRRARPALQYATGAKSPASQIADSGSIDRPGATSKCATSSGMRVGDRASSKRTVPARPLTSSA